MRFSIDVCENKENVLIKTNANVVIVFIFFLVEIYKKTQIVDL